MGRSMQKWLMVFFMGFMTLMCCEQLAQAQEQFKRPKANKTEKKETEPEGPFDSQARALKYSRIDREMCLQLKKDQFLNYIKLYQDVYDNHNNRSSVLFKLQLISHIIEVELGHQLMSDDQFFSFYQDVYRNLERKDFTSYYLITSRIEQLKEAYFPGSRDLVRHVEKNFHDALSQYDRNYKSPYSVVDKFALEGEAGIELDVIMNKRGILLLSLKMPVKGVAQYVGIKQNFRFSPESGYFVPSHVNGFSYKHFDNMAYFSSVTTIPTFKQYLKGLSNELFPKACLEE